MPKVEISKTELAWPGKYDENGKRREVERVKLPFQVIETINETRATREAAKKPRQVSLFDVWEAREGDTFEEGWKNKLIWGDNKYVMSSLLDKFAGKIDLIYIDPPFATGADFNFKAQIGEGDLEVFKEQSIIEEKAYRDTWGKYGPGRQIDSYLEMMYPRLVLMREMLSAKGSIWIHIGTNMVNYVESIADELFDITNRRNEIVVKRITKNLQRQFESVQALPEGHDILLWYSRAPETRFNALMVAQEPKYPEGYWKDFWSTADRPTMRYKLLGVKPTSGQWKWSQERAGEAVQNFRKYQEVGQPKGISLLEYWNESGAKLEFIRRSPTGKVEHWVRPLETKFADTLWFDISAYSFTTGFNTEKSEQLLKRIISNFSSEGDLVADFFCGSGTTCAVAEKLGRRWIGCDLSRYAIHITRKRLLGIENCKPLEVLNLGKYERKYWQGITFGGKKQDQQLAIFEYLAFILRLYGAQPLTGMEHLHGKKGNAVVHVGAVDAPVTIDEVNDCLDECLAIKQKELHILGWEWEMGLYDIITDAAKGRGIKLVLRTIPREVMEQQAVDRGDINFFELAYLETDIQRQDRRVVVVLKDFVIPNTELIPDEVRDKVKKWSDYIDYWAVDWDFQNDTFMNGWVAYRTRKERTLALESDPHTYEKPGNYTVMVKVIDIFGIDTSQAFEVEVR